MLDIDALAARLAAENALARPLRTADARAAVAILLQSAALTRADDPADERNFELEVLLLRRVERADDRWSGQIGLPGGRADVRDADLAATARRETLEEVGVDLARTAELVGQLAPVQAKARGVFLPLWITPFVFVARGALAPAPGPEATEVFWFPLGRAQAGGLAWTHRYRRGEEERVLPAWRDGERVVWGLTYEILSGFLRIAAWERGRSRE